ncbi:hypothetical protein [Saccharicrinis sp. 156]|uniref:hypothetical protein n=1 Tax=Saccharicrinis sp. 156 TaxID=3417574 RepID=UPI003D32C15F
MKAKLILPIIMLVVVSMFAGNWIYGKMSAKKLDAYLKQFPDNSQMQYAEVKVNPLWSKITFNDFSFTDPNTKITIKSEVLYVTMKHSEALEISKTRRIDKLTKLGLDCRQLKIFEDDKLILVSENTLFDFKGDMSQRIFEKMDKQFPGNQQYISLNIKDGEFKGFPLGKGHNGNILAGLNEIKSAEFKMLFKPDEKEIEIEKVEIKVAHLILKGKADINYLGQGLNDFSALKIDMDYAVNLTDEMTWGDSRTTGAYTLQSFSSAFEGDFEFDDKGELIIPSLEAKLSFNLKGVTVEYDEDVKNNIDMSLSVLGVSSSELSVNEFSFDASLNSGKCIVENTKLVLPLFEASLRASLNLKSGVLEDSDIDEMEMRITNINPNLNEAVNNLAGTFGLKIPRDGEDIVLEVKGSVENPKVKGIHY